MTTATFPTRRAAGAQRVLNVRRDPPDIRDRMYEPSLVPIPDTFDNREHAAILDQGTEGACTGFGLAAAINMLNRTAHDNRFRCSPRMLYEMAKKHDEWPGEDYAGSSCRGAIRGWRNMGVCGDGDWRYDANAPGELTVERAIAARRCQLGAYYRLRPEITDYHAAINEVGALYVSAQVHDGWFNPSAAAGEDLPTIRHSANRTGGHAFAIVGYNANGFIVQNSWGERWGRGGFAVWLYSDWAENVSDGWVFRLALASPAIFGLRGVQTGTGSAEARKAAPKRLEIAGHFAHFDDGSYEPRGDYWTGKHDVEQSAARIAGPSSAKYGHVLFYAHGGLNSPKASARRIRALKDGFRRNGIYPFHVMYDTGLVEEVLDTVRRAFGKATERSGGFLGDLLESVTDFTDTMIEDIVRKPVTPVCDEMKRDARLPFEKKRDGVHAIAAFAKALAGTGKTIHLAGHSTGAVLMGHLLGAVDKLGHKNVVSTCSLMAPACTVDFYRQHYEPRLGRGGAGKPATRLPVLNVYNLTEACEKDDHVAGAYRKSLLYLVSRAFERQPDKPILGMQVHAKTLPARPGLSFIIASEKGKRSKSISHGGFDNDAATLNDVMKTILGADPPKPFTQKEVEDY